MKIFFNKILIKLNELYLKFNFNLKKYYYLVQSKSFWKVKKYKNYEEYVDHQKNKTLDPIRRQKWLNEEWNTKTEIFKDCFKRIIGKYNLTINNSLCLGARVGQEVYALQQLKINCIGIDLVANPPYVIEGDVHNLSFEDNNFDFIFSNIFDHVLYPNKFFSEIERVSKKNCILVLHLSIGKSTDSFGVVEIASTNFINSFLDKFQKVTENEIDILSMNKELIFRKK